MPNTTFEIRRAIAGYQASGVLDTAAVRGTPLGAHATVDGKFVLAGTASAPAATGSNFVGFLERDCVVGGPTLPDHVYPNRIELPYTAGFEVSVIKAAEVEVEGGDRLLITGTGSLSTNTVVGTKITFREGKFAAAQSGETVYGTVSANNLTPATENALRMRFEMLVA